MELVWRRGVGMDYARYVGNEANFDASIERLGRVNGGGFRIKATLKFPNDTVTIETERYGAESARCVANSLATLSDIGLEALDVPPHDIHFAVGPVKDDLVEVRISLKSDETITRSDFRCPVSEVNQFLNGAGDALGVFAVGTRHASMAHIVATR